MTRRRPDRASILVYDVVNRLTDKQIQVSSTGLLSKSTKFTQINGKKGSWWLVFFSHALSFKLDSQSPPLVHLGTSVLHAHWLTDAGLIYSLDVEICRQMTRHFFIIS